MIPENCSLTEIGTTGNATVKAVTDAAGSQVIVQGEKVHLLSQPLLNHEEAILLGRQVVASGVECYSSWTNLRAASLIEQMLAVGLI